MDKLKRKALVVMAGVTQSQIAKDAEVSVAAISRVINGSLTTPRLRKIVAEAVNKPVDVLFPD